MPAKSQAQQRFMAGCEHNPKHMSGKCPSMSKEKMHEFTTTPRKGLPKRVEEDLRNGYRRK